MVDVKVKMEEYASFPTMIYKFNTNIDKKDNVKMASYIKDNDEMQTEDKLYKVSLFNPLFFDPRSQAHLLKPKHKSNWQNSGMLQFDAEVGCGLIFPSWLMHWVPPTQEERISVSWNIILRGDYGSHEEYQYANI